MRVTDEAGVLLRIGTFGLAAGVAYGLLAYEWVGTLALLTLGLGPLAAGVILVVHAEGGPAREKALTMFRRLAGFPPRDPTGPREDLEAEELMIIPSPSVWPFLLSLGSAVALTGLIFGTWLLLLGGLLVVWSLSGWAAAVSRETRLGRMRRAEASAGGSGAAGETAEEPPARAEEPVSADTATGEAAPETGAEEGSQEAAPSSERAAGVEPGRGRAGEGGPRG